MPFDSLRGTPGSRRMQRVAAGKEPVITTTHTISDLDTPLGAARANLTELERHSKAIGTRYNQAKAAYEAAGAELIEHAARITQRKAELAALTGATIEAE